MKALLLVMAMCTTAAAAPVEPGEPVAAPKAFDAVCKAGIASSNVTKEARCELLQELAGTPGNGLEGVALLRVTGSTKFDNVVDYYLAVRAKGVWRHFGKHAASHSIPHDSAGTLKAKLDLIGMELRKAAVQGKDVIVVSFLTSMTSTYNGEMRVTAASHEAYCAVGEAPRCLVVETAQRDVANASVVLEEWRRVITIKDDHLIYSLDPASKSWSEFMPKTGGGSLLKPGDAGGIHELDAL